MKFTSYAKPQTEKHLSSLKPSLGQGTNNQAPCMKSVMNQKYMPGDIAVDYKFEEQQIQSQERLPRSRQQSKKKMKKVESRVNFGQIQIKEFQLDDNYVNSGDKVDNKDDNKKEDMNINSNKSSEMAFISSQYKEFMLQKEQESYQQNLDSLNKETKDPNVNQKKKKSCCLIQ